MNRNAKRAIRTAKGLDREIWAKIVEGFHKADSSQKIEKLFFALLTAQERETIARRLAVISLIRAGKSYSEIGEKLWVSPVTISTIKKSLLVNAGYRSCRELCKEKDLEKLISKNSELPKAEPVFERWLDYIAFIIEFGPEKSGPHRTTLDYSWTAPIGYWRNWKKVWTKSKK